jgi:hypothetical protein
LEKYPYWKNKNMEISKKKYAKILSLDELKKKIIKQK